MSTDEKSRDAFRTIAEVGAILELPQHVLRYWESQFKQIKPVKRQGNRRLYRPSDIELIAGLKQLLHEQNCTLRGAQKILHEKGVKHVATLGAESLDWSGSPGVEVETPRQREAAEDRVVDSAETVASETRDMDAPVITERAATTTEPEPVVKDAEGPDIKDAVVISFSACSREFSFSSSSLDRLSNEELRRVNELLVSLHALRSAAAKEISDISTKFGLASTP